MQIQNAVKLINSIPDRWVRVDQLRRIPGGLEICFSIHKGKRGKKLDGWLVTCRGVHEATITDIDGGGLASYPSSHPAAQQYVARRAELRWPRTCDEEKVLGALYRAHMELVDDWIPFDRYLLVNAPWKGTSLLPDSAPASGSRFVCRGPDFLLRAYAKAIESIGERAQFNLRTSPKVKSISPKVLHFGESHVVADAISAQRPTGSSRPT